MIERKEVEKELLVHKEYLAKLAHYDSLTSLPNRIYFNAMLSNAIIKAREAHEKLAIMFVDLDRFKNINDVFGHHTGDLVLKEIAQRFHVVTNKKDRLARLGGDEFIMLLSEGDKAKFRHSPTKSWHVWQRPSLSMRMNFM